MRLPTDSTQFERWICIYLPFGESAIVQISQIETSPWEDMHDTGTLAFLFLQNIHKIVRWFPRVCFWVLYKQLLLQQREISQALQACPISCWRIGQGRCLSGAWGADHKPGGKLTGQAMLAFFYLGNPKASKTRDLRQLWCCSNCTISYMLQELPPNRRKDKHYLRITTSRTRVHPLAATILIDSW